MENKIFIVYHIFDTEGEFGDAEYTEEVVGIFENETDATEWVGKHYNPHNYTKSYDYLSCGDFRIEERELITHKNFNAECNYGYDPKRWDWSDDEEDDE